MDEITYAEAYKIADNMTKSWKWCTGILLLVVIGLLYCIISTETEATAMVNAEELKAKSIQTETN